MASEPTNELEPREPSGESEIVTPLLSPPLPSGESVLGAHVESCESSLCLADPYCLADPDRVPWFSDEPICGARGLSGKFRHAQIVQRRLARVRAPGFITLADLTAMRRVSRGTRGFDPDAPFDSPPRRLSRKKALAWRQEVTGASEGMETGGARPARIPRAKEALSTQGGPLEAGASAR